MVKVQNLRIKSLEDNILINQTVFLVRCALVLLILLHLGILPIITRKLLLFQILGFVRIRQTLTALLLLLLRLAIRHLLTFISLVFALVQCLCILFLCSRVISNLLFFISRLHIMCKQCSERLVRTTISPCW